MATNRGVFAGSAIRHEMEPVHNGGPGVALQVQQAADEVGGHAILFRNAGRIKAAGPLTVAATRLARNLRRVFDPSAILNPGLNLD